MHNLINIFAQLVTKQSTVRIIIPSKQFVPFISTLSRVLLLQLLQYIFLSATRGSPALPKGLLHNPLSTNLRRLQYDWVELYVHEVQPCTQWAGQDCPS